MFYSRGHFFLSSGTTDIIHDLNLQSSIHCTAVWAKRPGLCLCLTFESCFGFENNGFWKAYIVVLITVHLGGGHPERAEGFWQTGLPIRVARAWCCCAIVAVEARETGSFSPTKNILVDTSAGILVPGTSVPVFLFQPLPCQPASSTPHAYSAWSTSTDIAGSIMSTRPTKTYVLVALKTLNAGSREPRWSDARWENHAMPATPSFRDKTPGSEQSGLRSRNFTTRPCYYMCDIAQHFWRRYLTHHTAV